MIEKLYTIFESDEPLRKELKTKIGSKEIFKFVKDTIENSQNILSLLTVRKRITRDNRNIYRYMGKNGEGCYIKRIFSNGKL